MGLLTCSEGAGGAPIRLIDAGIRRAQHVPFLGEQFLKRSRAYWAGGLLSVPFVMVPLKENMYPYLAVLAVPLITNVFRDGICIRDIRITPLIGITIAIVWIHMMSYIVGPTEYGGRVFVDMAAALVAVGLLLAASQSADSSELTKGFWGVMIPAGALIMVIALVKYILLENGYVLRMLMYECGVDYPRGTNLCSDYNLFGIVVVAASIGFITNIFQGAKSKRVQLIMLISMALFVAVYSGSRRIYISIPVLIINYIACGIYYRVQIREITIVGMMILGSTVSLFFVFGSFGQNIVKIGEDYVIGANEDSNAVKTTALVSILEPGVPAFTELLAVAKAEAVADTEAPSLIESAFAGEPLLIPKVDPGTLYQSIDPNEAFGLQSRIERWRFGWELIKENGYIAGSGFAYHKPFSCRFVNCEYMDYPHAALISAWIYGGIVGIVIILGLYMYLLTSMLQAGWKGIMSGATPMVLVIAPSTLISGDTILSIPHFIISACLLESVLIDHPSRRKFVWQPFKNLSLSASRKTP